MVEAVCKPFKRAGGYYPLMVSERLVDVHKDYRGLTMEAIGQFRSYNRHEGFKNRLMLSVFVRGIHLWKNYRLYQDKPDLFGQLYLQGANLSGKHLLEERSRSAAGCEPSLWKIRLYPCISWGRNARFASGFEVGTRVRIWGRVQSREYTKKITETECEKRIL